MPIGLHSITPKTYGTKTFFINAHKCINNQSLAADKIDIYLLKPVICDEVRDSLCFCKRYVSSKLWFEC